MGGCVRQRGGLRNKGRSGTNALYISRTCLHPFFPASFRDLRGISAWVARHSTHLLDNGGSDR
ncbi:Uncharacterized protein DAT39_006395 [Clarias magur]|uniref:Uncharacterized protein n=1 Tax=Clarias magur TaxID=1594786 RepID=A0A8J4XD41_CLAMG|nr:Uncharacterized protein DAT39_006395 [Clarias magur]